TYGKGVVQSSYRLQDGSALKVTTSLWTSPNGKSINGECIVPDIEVKLDDIFYMLIADMEEDETIKEDSVSQFTKMAQMALSYLGYDPARTDGYFDEGFKNTLNRFKTANGMKADGVLDYETYDAIFDEVASVYALDYSRDPQLNKAKEVIRND
ncbi:MAG: peptidoglycan-binding protein, partial [Erysipelotrichaceae bacterium]|nr:peptidoglycan-binding protein [Erysipelotrichaceae bacterium]